MKKNMEFVEDCEGYKVYRNADGFLEGYRKTGKDKYAFGSGSDIKRIVSNQTTIPGFQSYVRGLRNKLEPKPLTASQLPSLFDAANQ